MFAWSKPIVPHIRKRALPIGISCLLAVVAAALAVAPFAIAYRLIRHALEGDTARMLVELPWLAGLAIAAILGRHACLVASTLAAHSAAFDIMHALRLDIARKCVRLPLDVFSRHATGRLKSIMRDDVDKLEDAISHAVPDIVSGIATPLLMVGFLVFLDWRLTLALVLMLPVLVAIYALTMRSKRTLIGEYGRKIVAFNSLAIEFIQGMKTLKSFGGDGRSAQRLMAIIDELADINRQAELMSLKPWVAFLTGLRATLLVVTPVGGLLYLAGSLDVVTFALFILVALVFTQPLLNLVYTAGSFFWKVSLAGKNIAWLMSADELSVTAGKVTPVDDAICLSDVSLSYDGVSVLRSIDLAIEPGTMTALIGPSGAGKTTLARLVARFMDPDTGSITIGGVDLRDLTEADLLDRIGIVFQDTFLFDDTIYENILLGRPDASAEEVHAAARRAQVLEFAERMPDGLHARVGDNGSGLSGGQRQRVAIARLLLKDAPIVLLDEATASLDPDCEALVQQALGELSRGKTLIVIAHRLHTIRHADQIVFMRDGTIHAAGAHDDLLADPDYAQFWKAHEGAVAMPLEASTSGAISARIGARDLSATQRVATTPREKPEKRTVFAQGWRDWLALSGPMKGTIVKRAMPLLALDVLFASTPVGISIGVLLFAAHGSLSGSLLAMATGGILLCFLLSALFGYAAQSCLFGVQRNAVRALQRDIVDKLVSLPIGFFQSRGVAMLGNLFSAHLFQLDFITPPGQVVRAMVIPALSGLILIAFDWRLAAAVFAGLPLFVLVLTLSSKTYARAWGRLVASRETAGARSIEFLLGLPVIRAYRLLDSRLSRFSEALHRERVASWAATTSLALSTVAAPAILELGFVLVMVVDAILFTSGRIDLDVFMLFIVVGLVFYRPMFEALELMSYGRTVARSAGEVRSVLAAPVMPEGEGGLSTDRQADLDFDAVDFRYPGGSGLRGLSFKAQPGTTTALVGGSGAGKSTVLSLATRFWDIDEGSIRIDGRDLRDLKLAQLRDAFSVVFQDTFLVTDTIAANIGLGSPEADGQAIERAARAAFAHEFIMAFPNGYDTVVGDGALSLSGGERQRIGIARAILKDALVLLLDEPTASVDPAAEQKIRLALKAAAAGKTVLVATHNMDIAGECDQILVLDDGAIIESGTHDALMQARGVYAGLAALYRQSRNWTLRPEKREAVQSASLVKARS